MKGKRCTTEDKIRILRAADRGEKSLQDICREENLSEVTFHRWKKQFGHMESFHGRFRDEGLNREQLWTLTEWRVVVGDYRKEDNQVRPHRRLGYESPAVLAAGNCPSPAPVGLRPPSAGDGQRTNKNINSTMSQD